MTAAKVAAIIAMSASCVVFIDVVSAFDVSPANTRPPLAFQETARRFAREKLAPGYQRREQQAAVGKGGHRDRDLRAGDAARGGYVVADGGESQNVSVVVFFARRLNSENFMSSLPRRDSSA